jgi:excisionase family DNA binding protein
VTTFNEAAELLGVSRELIHDLLRTGQLGSVKGVEEHRVDALHPSGVLGPQVVIQLKQCGTPRICVGGIQTPAAAPQPAAF